MKRFAGIYTPIATPFRGDGALDESGLQRNVQRWMDTPLTGLVVLGSNGEAAQLDDDESDRIIEVVRKGVPRDRSLIVGTGRESTRATIAATLRATALGADAVLVRTPSFFKPQLTTDVFVRHYADVADAAPVPVLLYNVTLFTGVNLQPEAVERLAAHPNIVGIKESGSDIGQIAEHIARTPDGFTVLAGSATTLFHALCAGCDGAILALASLLPDVVLRVVVAGFSQSDRRGPGTAASTGPSRPVGRGSLRCAGAQGGARPARLCRRFAASPAPARLIDGRRGNPCAAGVALRYRPDGEMTMGCRLLTLVVAAVVAFACATNPVTGRRELILMSEAQEIAVGQESDPQIKQEMGVYDDPELQRYVSELGLQMVQDSERPALPWQFVVVDQPAVNASPFQEDSST